MSLILSAPPIKSPLVERFQSPFGAFDLVTKVWENYFRSRDERLQSAAHVATSIELSAQAASIGATAIVSAADVALHRVSWYIRQTSAAGVSASLQVTVRWTDGGINLSKTGAALTTNTTDTYESQPSFMVRVDTGTNITYEVAYASNAAGAAQYALTVKAEAMG